MISIHKQCYEALISSVARRREHEAIIDKSSVKRRTLYNDFEELARGGGKLQALYILESLYYIA